MMYTFCYAFRPAEMGIARREARKRRPEARVPSMEGLEGRALMAGAGRAAQAAEVVGVLQTSERTLSQPIPNPVRTDGTLNLGNKATGEGDGRFGGDRPKNKSHIHEGIDVSAPAGTPVQSVLPGTVIFSGIDRNPAKARAEGYKVKILHGNGTVSTYMHLSPNGMFKLKKGGAVGNLVEAGQIVGKVAKSGTSGIPKKATPHVHLRMDGPGGVLVPNIDSANPWRLVAPGINLTGPYVPRPVEPPAPDPVPVPDPEDEPPPDLLSLEPDEYLYFDDEASGLEGEFEFWDEDFTDDEPMDFFGLFYDEEGNELGEVEYGNKDESTPRPELNFNFYDPSIIVPYKPYYVYTGGQGPGTGGPVSKPAATFTLQTQPTGGTTQTATIPKQQQIQSGAKTMYYKALLTYSDGKQWDLGSHKTMAGALAAGKQFAEYNNSNPQRAADVVRYWAEPSAS